MSTPRSIEFDKVLSTFDDILKIVLSKFNQFAHCFLSTLASIFVL